ncbi:MAG: AraC family transcriptional regulator, partial [Planctomycetota bacterium]
LVARINEIDHVATAGNQLVNQIHAAQTREQHLLSAALEARDQEQAAEQQATEAPERRHPVVFRAFQYYNENLHDRITLTNVARAVGLSPNRLLEVFREVGLQSPMACLRSMRMTRASALLQDRNLRVKEVAASVGYPSLAAFSRSYRKLYGLAPVESRRANGG